MQNASGIISANEENIPSIIKDEKILYKITGDWKNYPFDLYIKRANGTFTLYKSKCGQVPANINLMVKSDNLYIRIEDRNKQLKQFQEKLNQDLIQALTENPKKAKNIMAKILNIFLDYPSKDRLQECLHTIDIFGEALSKNDGKNGNDIEGNNALISGLLSVSSTDYTTAIHSVGVMILSMFMGKILKYDEKKVYLLGKCGLLHDIGKTQVEVSILKSIRKFTKDDYEKMKKHPIFGKNILEKLGVEDEVVKGAYEHHEKINGTGYPNGLKGDKVDEIARVLSICDIFEALSNKRPYKSAIGMKEVLKTIIDEAKTQNTLDIELVKKFVNGLIGKTYI